MMKCIVIQEPNKISIEEREIPQPGPYELLIKVKASGICGTDLHIYQGDYLGDYPVIPGHEFSGEVTRTGNLVTRFKEGDRIAVEPNIACNNCTHCLNNRQNFCLNWQAIGVTLPGGMAQYVAVPENAAFHIDELSYEYGAFVEPLSCVIHGVEKAKVSLGDRVLILGAGPIGNLILQVVRLQGASQVTVIERNPGRVEIARQFGADLTAQKLDDLENKDFDAVIDATGNLRLMNATIETVRRGGTILLFGVPPRGKHLQLDAFNVFHKGLTILSSFTSVRNSEQAVQLLQNNHIKVKPLISHRLLLEGVPDALELIKEQDPTIKKVMILPNG